MADETTDLNTEGDLLEEGVAVAEDAPASAEDETRAADGDAPGDEGSTNDGDTVENSIEETVDEEESAPTVDASIDAIEAPESDDNQTESQADSSAADDSDAVVESGDAAEEDEDESPPPSSSGIELTEEELAALDAEIAAQLDAEAEQEGVRDEWYFVHTYSGMENKVKKNLEHRIESMGMSDRILQVVVPTETEVEIRKGVRKEVEKRVFPGYILVNMVVDEDSWYVVRNTPGVTGFVGMGNKPTPLSPDEVARIMERLDADEPIVKVSFALGEHVRITGGPFAEFGGIVEEIHADKGKAKVMVSFFNRETPVEVDFVQLEKEDT